MIGNDDMACEVVFNSAWMAMMQRNVRRAMHHATPPYLARDRGMVNMRCLIEKKEGSAVRSDIDILG